jgi:quercetin dioxygenase-like cupin family protein
MPITIKDLPAREVVPGFFGRFVHGEQSTLTFWEIKAGNTLPLHHHIHEQITYIVSGELEMQIGEEKMVLSAGMSNVIPSNLPHSGHAITDCVVIDSFAPVREEYK